jgi:hypothetical protein
MRPARGQAAVNGFDAIQDDECIGLYLPRFIFL